MPVGQGKLNATKLFNTCSLSDCFYFIFFSSEVQDFLCLIAVCIDGSSCWGHTTKGLDNVSLNFVTQIIFLNFNINIGSSYICLRWDKELLLWSSNFFLFCFLLEYVYLLYLPCSCTDSRHFTKFYQ